MSQTSPHAIGESKLSITIMRKTTGDLVVSNYAIERYFPNDDTCRQALQEIVETITHAPIRPAREVES